jgi:uncharacterized spore protein YtfJ
MKNLIRGLCCLAAIAVLMFSSSLYAEEGSELNLMNFGKILAHNFSPSQTLGNPVEVGNYIVIPIVCKGMGFGMGEKQEGKNSSSNKDKDGAKNSIKKDRAGLGGGGFVKPIALIMIDKNKGDYKLIKLNEGIVSQMAKHLIPQMTKMCEKLIDYKMKAKNRMDAKKKAKKAALKRKKMKIEKEIILEKENQAKKEENAPKQ